MIELEPQPDNNPGLYNRFGRFVFEVEIHLVGVDDEGDDLFFCQFIRSWLPPTPTSFPIEINGRWVWVEGKKEFTGV